MGIVMDIWKKYQLNKLWRKKNKHNSTVPINYFEMDNVSVGNGTYGGLEILNFSNTYKLKIGNYCSVAPRVVFLLCADHKTNYFSTFPFKVKCCGTAQYEAVSKGNIIVDDDVWIGFGATIMSGVHIGQGAIIAAGAVVTKDVEPYAIYAGVPAKKIKMRFDKKIIDSLLKIDYSKLDYAKIEKYQSLLYVQDPTEEEIKKLNEKIKL